MRNIRQFDAFTCTRFIRDDGIMSGFPYPRAGGELVGAVYAPDDSSRMSDILNLKLPEPTHCSTNVTNTAPMTKLCFSDINDPDCVFIHRHSVYLECTYSEVFYAYVLEKLMVDTTAMCSPSNHMPTFFNYTVHVVTSNCSTSLAIRQYHERIAYPQTHYDVFKPHGLAYNAMLIIIDVLQSNNTAQILADGIPALLFTLKNMPPRARVLLQNNSATNTMMRHMYASRFRLGDKDWKTLDWVTTTETELQWGYKVVIMYHAAPLLVHANQNLMVNSNIPRVWHSLRSAFLMVQSKQSNTQLPTCNIVDWTGTVNVTRMPVGWIVNLMSDIDAVAQDHTFESLSTTSVVVVKADAVPIFAPSMHPTALLVILTSEPKQCVLPIRCFCVTPTSLMQTLLRKLPELRCIL